MDFLFGESRRLTPPVFSHMLRVTTQICLSLRCQLDFIKKICYNIKKRHFFPKVKRSALNYYEMELQLNTVPPKVNLQRECVPKGEEKCGLGS